MSTLLLFDLDGTLLQTKAGRIAFNRAFEAVYGLTDAAHTVTMAGRTDPAIHRELCELHAIDPHTFGAWKRQFLSELADALQAHPGVLLPGVVALLAHCAGDSDYILAMGTGNVEEGARLKLAPHDLNRYFPTGGFGADGETRDEVIARGISRAIERAGKPFERVVVIGDTPHDIACGKANQCVTLGVATGPYSEQELRESGADLVLADLADTPNVLRLLRHLPQRLK